MKQITIVTMLVVFVSIMDAASQTTLPYFNYFDNPGDTVGWSHYAINGTDDWELGAPNHNYFSSAYSSPNSWVTNLTGNFSGSSNMVLETPSFDFSDTSTIYNLSFYRKTHAGPTTAYWYFEYSNDNGVTWQLLNDANAQKKNWQTSIGFDNYWLFKNSAIQLDFLQGQPNVKFRFRMTTTNSTGEGWLVDDFSIQEDYHNLYSIPPIVRRNKYCPAIDISIDLIYDCFFPVSFSNTCNYYWSTDSIFDSGDTLLGSKTQLVSSTLSWDQSFNIRPNLPVGRYFVFYFMDTDNNLDESNELDNSGMVPIVVDSVYEVPLISSFDDSSSLWSKGGGNAWQLEPGDQLHYEGAHSDPIAWSIFTNSNADNYIESPRLDLSDGDTTVLSFWYKSRSYVGDGWGGNAINFIGGCTVNLDGITDIEKMRDNTWDFFNVFVTDTSRVSRLRIYNGDHFNDNGKDLVIDDIYVGEPLADLSIERNKTNRFSSNGHNTHTLVYYLNNSGLKSALSTVTAFYWSSDSIFDSSDILLGSKQEPALLDTARVWSSFTFTKPSLAIGKYYIIYSLDTANTVDEMMEYNNMGYFTFYQGGETLPYYNDFETQIDGWRHNASIGEDNWEWTTPSGPILDTAFSGVKAIITNNNGWDSITSRMHFYTPVFDLTAVANPVLEFDMILHGNSASGDYAKMNMSYSIDGGANWIVLDNNSPSYNRWYQGMEFNDYTGLDQLYYLHNSANGFYELWEYCFDPTNGGYNGRDTKRNTRQILDLDSLGSENQIQFRYNLITRPNSTYHGALIDNFTIRDSFIDLNVDYKKALMLSSKSQTIRFFMHMINNGNYISAPSVTKFYLSVDTLLDSSDYFAGQKDVPEIRPDMQYYINASFPAPGNFGNYYYLIYELDEGNTNSESNELNNIGYWPLKLDSIKSYPYFNDFESTIIDGWYQFTFEDTLYENWRFRNKFVPAETFYQWDNNEDGAWFTERINPILTNYPYFYLETPSFNFSKIDSVFISFDLMCIGQGSYNGGNLHFSTDGGNTWSLLNNQVNYPHNGGANYNWYYPNPLNDLDNELGWTGHPTGGSSNPGPDSISFDASFLKGLEDVSFRFKYKSNYYPYGASKAYGMRLDNFNIGGYNVDYVANNIMETKNIPITSTGFNIDFSISNNGQTNGRDTKIRFYWSNDSIFDSGDTLIEYMNLNPIQSGATLASIASLLMPSSIIQSEYYLFYYADADSNLVELFETNNLGSFIIKLCDQHLDNTVSSNGVTLISNQAGATYQWLLCSSPNYFPISGETGQSFTPTVSGEYAVEIYAQGACPDTSECILISIVGIIENNLDNNLKVYPNPTEGIVLIELDEKYSYIKANIFDARGQLLKTLKFTESKKLSLGIEGPPGYYFVDLESDKNRTATIKILKKK